MSFCMLLSTATDQKVGTKTSHILKTIQSEDGDIIDCIEVYKQPAFDHPALRNHTIQKRREQMAPSFEGNKNDIIEGEDFHSKNMGMEVRQVWKRRGVRCPKGTIPVRRTMNQQPLSSRAIRKPHYYFHTNNNFSSVQLANHSKAILLTVGYRYLGAKGDIKVFNPNVEKDDEYTTSQVSLNNGPYYDYESVESGWAVNPSVYGDRQTRFFVYWTSDGSRTTGCFDLTCPGFVQTSNEIALGAAIYPLPLPNALPYQITVYIFKDPMTNNWWVEYGEKIKIGYWPGEIFEALRSNAESVEWGGEVYSTTVGHTPHTATGMGSGRFPDTMFGYSGIIKRIRIHDNSAALKFPEWVETFTDEFNCYDVLYVGDYIVDPEFYYGGPGKNPMCP
ncbi:protein neprosin-like [Humulus lupulus]|uniref:protein neprosin-like n=1 Tax=Humulus lupulus TaxID=3486 RepID=UPI002B404115|nr:protein neprosin-like [Humulus lupulus]